MKFLIIIVLVFFLLSTGLMFILYLASPSTIVDIQDTNLTIEEPVENQGGEEVQIIDQQTIIQDNIN